MVSVIILLFSFSLQANEFNVKEFGKKYYKTWTKTQAPEATKKDLHNYLDLLKEDVGHQHFPYDPDDVRHSDGKALMLEGMTHYLGGHTEYSSQLISLDTLDDQVIVVVYDTQSKLTRPNGELLEQNYRTMEILELEDHKVSVIRKYSKKIRIE